jgi:hypothetical protein
LRFSDEYPRQEHIRFTHEFALALMGMRGLELSAAANLTAASARARVWNIYSSNPPTDGGIPDDDKTHKRIRMTKGEWESCRASILNWFDLRDGKIYPPDDWIDFACQRGFERPAIPAGLRTSIMRRDGYACTYCGTTDGPFDIDHIVPVSRGGHPLSEDNLACACAPCNRSNAAKSVEEWVNA